MTSSAASACNSLASETKEEIRIFAHPFGKADRAEARFRHQLAQLFFFVKRESETMPGPFPELARRLEAQGQGPFGPEHSGKLGERGRWLRPEIDIVDAARFVDALAGHRQRLNRADMQFQSIFVAEAPLRPIDHFARKVDAGHLALRSLQQSGEQRTAAESDLQHVVGSADGELFERQPIHLIADMIEPWADQAASDPALRPAKLTCQKAAENRQFSSWRSMR